MKMLLAILLAFTLIGEYSVSELMIEPPLRYDGSGRGGSPLALYNTSTDSPVYIPLEKGRFRFEFQGVVYKIIPIENGKIQVYREGREL